MICGVHIVHILYTCTRLYTLAMHVSIPSWACRYSRGIPITALDSHDVMIHIMCAESIYVRIHVT